MEIAFAKNLCGGLDGAMADMVRWTVGGHGNGPLRKGGGADATSDAPRKGGG